MSASVPGAAGRAARPARYLIPPGVPRRRELLACLALAGLLAGLLFAQVSLALAIFFHIAGKASRWRPRWLAAPAAGGGLWVLGAGWAASLRGFAAAGRAVLAALARLAGDRAGPARHPGLTGGPGHWLAGQLPLALVVAAGMAAAAWWLGWLHTSEWELPAARPGPAALCRRRVTARRVRAGGVVTRDGTCLGVDRLSGGPVSVPWQEARRGVLVAGSDRPAVSASAFQLLHAAIRRRQPVIAVDLSGDVGLAASVAAACAAAGVPFQQFGAAGPGRYEPWRRGGPARQAALVMALIDWAQAPDLNRLACQAWLTEAFAILSAGAADCADAGGDGGPGPAGDASGPGDAGDPGGPGDEVLAALTALLRPGALRARLEQVPPGHPRRHELVERAGLAASRLEADPRAAAFVAGQLQALRTSTLGRWLCPEAGPGVPGAPSAGSAAAAPTGTGPAGTGPAGTGPRSLLTDGRSDGRAAGERISLAEVVRRRGVALFSMDREPHGRTADVIADLVALDLADLQAGLVRDGGAGDGMAWLGGCETVGEQARPRRLAAGTEAGFATVLTTTSAAAVTRLAAQVNVLVLYRPHDPAGAGEQAWLTGTRRRPIPLGPGPWAGVTGWAGGPAGGGGRSGHQPAPGLAGAAGPGLAAGQDQFPVVPAEALWGLGDHEFTLVVRGQPGTAGAPDRVLPRATAVLGQIRGWPGATPASLLPAAALTVPPEAVPPVHSPPASPLSPASPVPPTITQRVPGGGR